MNEGELKKRIREKAKLERNVDLGVLTDVAFAKEEYFKILDEAKQEIKPISLINYPCEDAAARAIYAEKIYDLNEAIKKWFGSAGASLEEK